MHLTLWTAKLKETLIQAEAEAAEVELVPLCFVYCVTLGFLMLNASILLSSNSAIAAEQVVLKYRSFRESISVEELSNFAETGELSTSLRLNLALARQDPRQIRQYLTQPVVNVILLDRVLNSRIGNFVLDEVSQTVHTPSRQVDRQALRSALVLSASGDSNITLIDNSELPDQEVEVEDRSRECLPSTSPTKRTFARPAG